ncbi:ATP-binding protein [Nocardioides sp. C4-1]|uniref:PAS domain-containing sensor histidine kinase n=1 Tax=Nocardioides sp. C4-1 TaxID=3151851 RepID=UPI0032648E28
MTAPRATPARAGEVVVQVAVLVAVLAAVFAPGQQLPLMFVTATPLVWAALRLPWSMVAVELAGFAAVVSGATVAGLGPVGTSGLGAPARAATVAAFVVSVAVVVLVLARGVRRRAELVARATADSILFRRAFTESPLGLLLLRGEGDHLVVEEINASAVTILGTPHADAIGTPLDDLIARDGPDEAGLRAVVSGRLEAWHGWASVPGRPGSRLEVTVAALDGGGGPRTYSAQLLDVTGEHEARRRLLTAERLHEATIDTTASVTVVIDADGVVVRANPVAAELAGVAEGELVGRPVWESGLGALSRAEVEALFVWPNRSDVPVVTERTTSTGPGRVATIVWHTRVVRDDIGTPSHAVLTGTDVTAARSSAQLTTRLLGASISTALVGVSADGLITFVNAGAEHMLGWSADDVRGRAFAELFDADELRSRADGFAGLLRTIEEGGETPARDWTWRTRDREAVVVSMTVSRTGDDGGDLLCVARDVTEQRATQGRLRDALEKERAAIERLRSLDRAKDEFVSTVSHELRTPVTSIVGYTEMLRDGSVVDAAPAQHPLLDKIARNGARLVAICDDLLLLSGFDSDAATGVPTRVDLRSCVTNAVDTTPAGDVRVHVVLDPEPVEVVGDRAQLDRVVANLLGNAVKFTSRAAGAAPDGEVRVTLQRDAGHAVLEVADTGIGIAPDDLSAVFDRFYRSEEAQLRAVPGTGLGLSIVAAVVEAHDGRLTLDSEPGRGATFSVRVPLVDTRVDADVRRG